MKLKQSISTMATDKENPNPTIHLTQKRTQLSQSSDAPLLGSHSIRRYALGSKIILGLGHGSNADYADIESTLPSVPTAEERLVAVALSEAACINDKNVIINPLTDNISPYVELLHNAGFPMFKQHQLQNALKTPSFTPCGISKSTNATTQKRDAITANEVFEIIRNIQDPEHPLTLEQLNVVRIELVEVVDVHPDIGKEAAIQKGDKKPKFSTVRVQFTPTIPHCSMATLIGLTLRVKLLRSLPARFKVVVKIEPGTHVSEHAVNKQLADKERVRAALENEHLLGVVNKCIAGTG